MPIDTPDIASVKANYTVTTGVLIATGIAVVVTGIAGWLTIKWMRERTHILGLPVVTGSAVHTVSGDAIAHGSAAGVVVTSPWTQRDGLLFSATEVVEYERRKNDGTTDNQTRHNFLGLHHDAFGVQDHVSGHTIAVEPGLKPDLRHLPTMKTGRTGVADMSISIGGISLGSGPLVMGSG